MPSLLEALERKYGAKGEVNPCIDDMPVAIFVPKRSPRLSVPTLLVLNDCDIDCAGDAGALADKCADVVELDLANNKLTEWQEVFAILEQTPRVRFLNLSFNRLSAQIQAAQSLQPKWDSLSHLVLNSTYVGWPSILGLLKSLPALEELHLSLNEYSYVDLSGKEIDEKDRCEACSRLNVDFTEPVHEQLKKLHFSGNPVSSWREISKLGYAFPNLETLLVNECPIATLEPDPCEKCGDANGNKKSHDAFSHLRFLNLNNTGLATWDEVDRLSLFPALRSLRVQGWPLWERFESTEHERRLLLVARLPRVRTLNGGGAVPVEERDAAERAFIRYYMEKPEADRPDRYWELVGVHGKLDPLVSVDLRPEKRVQITFTCGDTSEVRTVDVYRTVSDLKTRLERLAGFPASKMRLFYVDQELRDTQFQFYLVTNQNLRPEKRVQITFTCGDTSEVRTVDVYRTVSDLKTRLERLAGFPASKMRLFYVDQELRDTQGPEEMKYPTKQLYSYNIRSGDEIIIDSKFKHSISVSSTA
ncbi:Tubulin-specific chaperone cofactor E-like protein [Papilio xuthus]|uniref:Tubulin-specific chaperone cofactor E-like protein n=1 Tax=Papilio xuthus TaxID=66420 RepID=A0A194PMV5_PAPXU|nr:Tubulin-specific chaperone cofactor E-like protein [Papilio xuthus]